MKRNKERDDGIVKFVSDMVVSSYSTIKQKFFNDKAKSTAYQVLDRLCKYEELDTQRHFFVNESIYWIPKCKPEQLKHMLLRDVFYRRLSNYYKVILFECREFNKFDGFRPDAFIAFETSNNKQYYAFLEVEISDNKFNTDKYIEFYNKGKWRDYMDEFPLIFALTNKKKIKTYDKFNILIIDEEFKTFDDIIQNL